MFLLLEVNDPTRVDYLVVLANNYFFVPPPKNNALRSDFSVAYLERDGTDQVAHALHQALRKHPFLLAVRR